MDKNKLIKLKECEYKIQKCCSLCQWSVFLPFSSYFGTCMKIHYKHLKHFDEERELSINRWGVCNKFDLDEEKSFCMVSNYVEFMDK